MRRRELERLTDDELRAAARERGMIIGATLPRAQLIELLVDGDAEDGGDEAPTRATNGLTDRAAQRCGNQARGMGTRRAGGTLRSHDEASDFHSLCGDGSQTDRRSRSEEIRSPRKILPGDLFATVSLARLMAKQGMRRRAEEICHRVLAEESGSGAGVRARDLLGQISAPTSPRPGADQRRSPVRDGEAAFDLDESASTAVRIYPRDPRSVVVIWQGDQGLDQLAARLLGAGSDRILRLHNVWLSPSGEAVRQRFDDLPIETLTGQTVFEVRPGSTSRCACGWRDRAGGFLSLGHSSVARTPPSDTSPLRRPRLATVPRAEDRRLSDLLLRDISRRRDDELGRGVWLWDEDLLGAPPEEMLPRVEFAGAIDGEQAFSSWSPRPAADAR